MKTKDSKTVFNLPAEWITNLLLIVAQAVLIGVMAGFGRGGDWVYWMIFGSLVISDVFFLFMLLYKVYRARFTLVTLSKTELVYRRAFKKFTVEAEDLVVALCDYGKPGSVVKYAMIYDKNDEGGAFIFAVSGTRCLKKIAAVAPRILLTFVTACTEGKTLEKLKTTASDDLKGYIERELEAREANAHPAPDPASKKKKRKKKKK